MEHFAHSFDYPETLHLLYPSLHAAAATPTSLSVEAGSLTGLHLQLLQLPSTLPSHWSAYFLVLVLLMAVSRTELLLLSNANLTTTIVLELQFFSFGLLSYWWCTFVWHQQLHQCLLQLHMSTFCPILSHTFSVHHMHSHRHPCAPISSLPWYMLLSTHGPSNPSQILSHDQVLSPVHWSSLPILHIDHSLFHTISLFGCNVDNAPWCYMLGISKVQLFQPCLLFLLHLVNLLHKVLDSYQHFRMSCNLADLSIWRSRF